MMRIPHLSMLSMAVLCGWLAEILVVHGGTDRTRAITTEMARTNPHIVPIRNENDQGKGHAIQVGVAHATHDVMCQ